MGEYVCPRCGKPIYDDEALLCLYCGESLKRPVGFLGNMKYAAGGKVMWIVLFLVLLSFIFLVTL